MSHWKSVHTAFGLNTEGYGASLRIHSKYGKIRTRKNSVFGHFPVIHRVIPKISVKTVNFFSKTYVALHGLMLPLIPRLFSQEHCAGNILTFFPNVLFWCFQGDQKRTLGNKGFLWKLRKYYTLNFISLVKFNPFYRQFEGDKMLARSPWLWLMNLKSQK